jgi:hypothetical protein
MLRVSVYAAGDASITCHLPSGARRDGLELAPLVFRGLGIRADPEIDADALHADLRCERHQHSRAKILGLKQLGNLEGQQVGFSV